MKQRNVAEDGWQSFIELCGDARDLKELFELFFTFEEKETMGLRYLLIKALLAEKKTQREISADLKISISKITRGSNALKTIHNRLKEELKARMLEQ